MHPSVQASIHLFRGGGSHDHDDSTREGCVCMCEPCQHMADNAPPEAMGWHPYLWCLPARTRVIRSDDHPAQAIPAIG